MKKSALGTSPIHAALLRMGLVIQLNMKYFAVFRWSISGFQAGVPINERGCFRPLMSAGMNFRLPWALK